MIFLKKNWIILLILVLGAFLRLYKISHYMTFLGDEGRDALIVRNLLVYFDPILIGPGTSVGSMYLGPLYYYFMAPFLFLSNFSPVGPAVGVALLGVATIYLVYLAGRDWFGEKAGIMSSFLFAISPIVILYSHSSWNPNIMPFFALLSVYSIWKVYSQNKYNWIIVTAISFAFVLQSHYLGVLIAPVLLFYWLKSKTPLKYTIISVIAFIFLMSPLLIFDIRHSFLNSKALHKFITVRQETVTFKPLSIVTKAYPIFNNINNSLVAAKNKNVASSVSLFMVLSFAFAVFKNRKLVNENSLPVILWIVTGVIGLGLYDQTIHDHYFGFLFPAPFLLIGFLLNKIYDSKYKMLAVLFFIFLVVLNLNNNPFKKNPNNQMRRAENVAVKVIEISENKPFNIAVLSSWNYEDGYQYFLEKENSKIVEIDSQLPSTVTDQLIVICENIRDKCDPTHSPKAEVANFGWSKIDSEYKVDGVTIFKLIHAK